MQEMKYRMVSICQEKCEYVADADAIGGGHLFVDMCGLQSLVVDMNTFLSSSPFCAGLTLSKHQFIQQQKLGQKWGLCFVVGIRRDS